MNDMIFKTPNYFYFRFMSISKVNNDSQGQLAEQNN